MVKNLVIVESPAKAKTIEGFLGNGFMVKSCVGHIRDLQTKKLSVDTENKFTPTYEVPSEKIKVVAELRKYSRTAKTVWLATDEDREGEAISWHLVEALNLDQEKVKRIVFHEITKSAILNAIANPRRINMQLVNAQQARRVLDRLVGYEISPVLWKKVKPSLSAGRVQSVAVRLIVEREREILKFESLSFYRVIAEFHVFKAECAVKFNSDSDAKKFLKECINSDFNVIDLEVKPLKKTPAPPFTTSTLQQEASRKLGFSVAQTMVVAQKLYESGKITYMRTDSVNLSDTALAAAGEEIKNSFGKQYVKIRKFQTKTKGAQEAHEAIRPTFMQNKNINGDRSEQRLYDLIWKRTLASQMSEAQIEKTIVTIGVSGSDIKFTASGEVIKFDGFLKVYMESADESNIDITQEPAELSGKSLLPSLEIGEKLNLEEMVATQRFTKNPPRYTEAALVKKLEELGIGRPSTYAPTISTIQKREYVIKEDREGTERPCKFFKLKDNSIVEGSKIEITGAEKSKLFPSDIGMVVNDFLMNNFENIFDYNFTANVEKEFDAIEDGTKQWNEMISQFYGPFHQQVENTLKTSEKASGERNLGKDPASGKPVTARIGRYGPIVQIGESGLEEKPKFASLRKDQSIESLTLENALELFKLPRVIGDFEKSDIVAAIGRFGPYIRHNGKFYSLKKDDNPYTVQLIRAVEIIEEKRIDDGKRIIKSFEKNKDVQILNGKYGPYISIGKNNFKIPKEKNPANLSLGECLEIAESSPPKKNKSFNKKKK